MPANFKILILNLSLRPSFVIGSPILWSNREIRGEKIQNNFFVDGVFHVAIVVTQTSQYT